MTSLHDLSEPFKHAVDILAGVTVVATLLSWIPAVTAVLALLWTGMRIFESYQNILINRRKLRE